MRFAWRHDGFCTQHVHRPASQHHHKAFWQIAIARNPIYGIHFIYMHEYTHIHAQVHCTYLKHHALVWMALHFTVKDEWFICGASIWYFFCNFSKAHNLFFILLFASFIDWRNEMLFLSIQILTVHFVQWSINFLRIPWIKRISVFVCCVYLDKCVLLTVLISSVFSILLFSLFIWWSALILKCGVWAMEFRWF